MFYTDGLVETRNGREEYGIKRLTHKVTALAARPAAEISASVLADVQAFIGGQGQKDDVTLAIVKRVTL